MRMKHVGIVAALVASIVTAGAAQQQQQPLVSKKLIQVGAVPTPAYIRANIRAMEKLPFDGLIFRLSGSSHEYANVFVTQKWDEAKFTEIYDDCKNIQWQKFTDNFLITHVATSDGWDWFSDAHWEAVRHNLGIIVKAATLSRCRGICFDAEAYGNSPWKYPKQVRAKEKTFDEYQDKVRQRGAEFMRTITAQLPKPVIHTFFQVSYFSGLMDEPDLKVRAQQLSQAQYALLPAFFNGMLDAAGPDVLFTDGNENSYYYTDPLEFYQSFHMVKQRALCLVAPENTRKYQEQMQMSHAIYVDYLFGLGVWAPAFVYKPSEHTWLDGMRRRSPVSELSPAERQQWCEHNTYYALATADEFVWFYSEKMDWWTNEGLPPGLQQAVVSAREKIAAHQPLGFDIAPMIKAAEARHQAASKTKLTTRTADIPKAEQAPAVDGDLSDAAWQKAAVLEAFVPYAGITDKPKAATEARVAYDRDNLYIAVRCQEPNPKAMKPAGANRDDAVWEGDSVDVFVSRGEVSIPYVHLIVSAGNVVWDALCVSEATNDTKLNANLKSAVKLGEKEWTLEMAIPWAELKMKAPEAGAKLKANLCRARIPDGEQTTWSQTTGGFNQPQSFGTWTFK